MEHENVLRLYCHFNSEDKLYLCLEYAKYGEIYKILAKEGKFSEEKSSFYIKQVLKGLSYMHKVRVMHRDIKPENLLLAENNVIKISDFGWSVCYSSSRRRKTLCGTLDYLRIIFI